VDDYGEYVVVPAGSWAQITHDEGDALWLLTSYDDQVVELEGISPDDVEITQP
jgi:hypothetical protein